MTLWVICWVVYGNVEKYGLKYIGNDTCNHLGTLQKVCQSRKFCQFFWWQCWSFISWDVLLNSSGISWFKPICKLKWWKKPLSSLCRNVVWMIPNAWLLDIAWLLEYSDSQRKPKHEPWPTDLLPYMIWCTFHWTWLVFIYIHVYLLYICYIYILVAFPKLSGGRLGVWATKGIHRVSIDVHHFRSGVSWSCQNFIVGNPDGQASYIVGKFPNQGDFQQYWK